MSGRTKVIAVDIDTMESEETEIPADDYVLVCGGDLYLSNIVAHANGTTVLTIKRKSVSE